MRKLRSTRLDEFISPHVAILILRVGAAALLMTHGFPKLMRIMEGNLSFADPIGIGEAPTLILVTFAEAICAAIVLAGFYTRLFLIPIIINMIGVVFIAHADDPFGQKELGLFFLIVFVTLFLTGPGKFSLDRIIRG